MLTKLKSILKKRTSNAYLEIELPYVETPDFKIFMEAVANELLPSGWDWQYAIINKRTDMVEMRTASLSIAVVMMQNSQVVLDKVITGEINGMGPALTAGM